MAKCEDCKYWDFEEGGTDEDDNKYGECRCHSPVIINALLYQPDQCEEGDSGRIAVFPCTNGDYDWCGEFKSKEKSADELICDAAVQEALGINGPNEDKK